MIGKALKKYGSTIINKATSAGEAVGKRLGQKPVAGGTNRAGALANSYATRAVTGARKANAVAGRALGRKGRKIAPIAGAAVAGGTAVGVANRRRRSY